MNFSWQLARDSAAGIQDGKEEEGVSVIYFNLNVKVVMCDCGKVYKIQSTANSCNSPNMSVKNDSNNNNNNDTELKNNDSAKNKLLCLTYEKDSRY